MNEAPIALALPACPLPAQVVWVTFRQAGGLGEVVVPLHLMRAFEDVQAVQTARMQSVPQRQACKLTLLGDPQGSHGIHLAIQASAAPAIIAQAVAYQATYSGPTR